MRWPMRVTVTIWLAAFGIDAAEGVTGNPAQAAAATASVLVVAVIIAACTTWLRWFQARHPLPPCEPPLPPPWLN